MKKLNEGPTIQKNHKGNHLTNADGEIVQSFGKDRAGLKAARQAMYKNYKGLNVKKPEPEPQEEPVEEDIIGINEPFTKSGMKKDYKDSHKRANPTAPKDSADKAMPNKFSRKPWDFFKGRPTNEDEIEENIHDDMALMKKQHNASVDAGNDPRLQWASGEKLERQQHKANRGVDMPADAFNASDSRKVLDMEYGDKFGKFDWDKPVEFAKPDARALALNKQAKAARANFKKFTPLTQTQRDTYKQSRNAQTAQANKRRVANGLKPFPMESQNPHDDMALMKKQHNASVDAGNDPRLQIARGEKLMKQQYKTNRGVDMPAGQVAKMQSGREVFDMDYDSKFGKYDWDKPVEFAKPTDAQLAKHNEIMANRKNFNTFKNPISAETRERYKQSRNAQTAQANKQRIAKGMKPFALEDAITEEFGETFTVHPSRVSQKGHYKVFYSIHDQLKIAQIARWATKNKITIQKYDTNKIIIHGSASDHRNMVRYLRDEGIRGDATVMNPTITSKDQSIHSGDADIRQTYDFDSDGHFVTDRGEEDIGHGVSARIQQKIQQDRLMNNEDRKMSDLENKLKEQLEEGITVNTTSTNDDNVEDSMTVTAQGADAMELMNMLKMAGIGGQAEAPVSVDEIPAEDEGCGCSDMPNEIDSMRDMIGTMDNINVEVIPLDDEMVEEEAELANAPDEKYADTDVLVNKISGGLNRRKKQYRKEYPGDNPMAVESDESDSNYLDKLQTEIRKLLDKGDDESYAKAMELQKEVDKLMDERFTISTAQVTESEEELTARFLKEYDEFKVTAPEDSDEGDWEIENIGKWAVKIGKNAPEPEMSLDAEIAGLGDGFSGIIDTELAGVLADEAVEEGLVEDDVEEGLRMEFPDGSCEGSKCPPERNRRTKDKDESPEEFSKKLDKPKSPKDDALDKEMSEDKK